MTHPLPPNKSAQGFTRDPADGTTKGELIPTMMYGDGRPWDVGVDRALINNVNFFQDRKSAHQGPSLWASADLPASIDSTKWLTMFASQIFLGTEHQSASVARSLTVAPQYRSYDNTSLNNAEVRMTLSRVMPQLEPSLDEATLGNSFYSPQYTGEFSQTAVWSTNSMTLQTGADKTLELGPQDLQFGLVWLVIEGRGPIDIRGLAKCIEGPRRRIR